MKTLKIEWKHLDVAGDGRDLRSYPGDIFCVAGFSQVVQRRIGEREEEVDFPYRHHEGLSQKQWLWQACFFIEAVEFLVKRQRSFFGNR